MFFKEQNITIKHYNTNMSISATIPFPLKTDLIGIKLTVIGLPCQTSLLVKGWVHRVYLKRLVSTINN